jgi:hypothetical protein
LPILNRLVVADTGPLIALARIGRLDLLPTLFQQVLLTPTVLDECEAKPDRGEGREIRAVLASKGFQLQTPEATLPMLGIDPGETSAIALAQQLGAGVLMDDKAGRTVAKRLGIAVIGTVGVLVLAKRRGLLLKVRPLLDALIESGCFLGSNVINEALRLSDE